MIQTRLRDASFIIPIEMLLLTFKNLLVVRIHQAEEITAKRLSQGRNNVTELRNEPATLTTGRHKNGPLNHSTTLPALRFSSISSSKFSYKDDQRYATSVK